MAFIGTFQNGGITGRTPENAGLLTQSNFHRRNSLGGVYQSSGSTTHFLHFSRWWWGIGNFHIELFENLYGPNSDYGHFLVNGHTRSGNPSIGTIYNTGIGTPYPANYNSTYERCQIKFDHSSYRRFHVIVENFESTYVTSDSAVGHNGPSGGANSWHMYNSTEII